MNLKEGAIQELLDNLREFIDEEKIEIINKIKDSFQDLVQSHNNCLEYVMSELVKPQVEID